MPAGGPIRRVVLVGFMASGKSTVGRILARLLDWRFLDFDEEIERRSGRTIPEIFAAGGEAAFRGLESALTAEVGGQVHIVLAPGGGWITRPGVLDLLPDDSLVAWLRVSPEEAVRRAAVEATHRPLLAGPDPLAKAMALLAEREPLYEMADLVIDVDARTPDEVARELQQRIEMW